MKSICSAVSTVIVLGLQEWSREFKPHEWLFFLFVLILIWIHYNDISKRWRDECLLITINGIIKVFVLVLLAYNQYWLSCVTTFTECCPKYYTHYIEICKDLESKILLRYIFTILPYRKLNYNVWTSTLWVSYNILVDRNSVQVFAYFIRNNIKLLDGYEKTW